MNKLNMCLYLKGINFTKHYHFKVVLRQISSKYKHYYLDPRCDFIELCGQVFKKDDWTNITPKIISLVNRSLLKEPNNPLSLVAQATRQFFDQFDHLQFDSPIVDLCKNFDELLIAKDHSSRKNSESYYLNKDYLLRTHTSAHQNECLKKGSTSFVCIADVYRRDSIDSTHYPAFHQCELFHSLTSPEVRKKERKALFNKPLIFASYPDILFLI